MKLGTPCYYYRRLVGFIGFLRGTMEAIRTLPDHVALAAEVEAACRAAGVWGLDEVTKDAA